MNYEEIINNVILVDVIYSLLECDRLFSENTFPLVIRGNFDRRNMEYLGYSDGLRFISMQQYVCDDNHETDLLLMMASNECLLNDLIFLVTK